MLSTYLHAIKSIFYNWSLFICHIWYLCITQIMQIFHIIYNIQRDESETIDPRARHSNPDFPIRRSRLTTPTQIEIAIVAKQGNNNIYCLRFQVSIIEYRSEYAMQYPRPYYLTIYFTGTACKLCEYWICLSQPIKGRVWLYGHFVRPAGSH